MQPPGPHTWAQPGPMPTPGYMPPAFGTQDQSRFYQPPGGAMPHGPPGAMPLPEAMRPPHAMMGAQGCNINTRPPPNQPGINPYLMGGQDPLRPGPGPLGAPMGFGGMGPGGPFQPGFMPGMQQPQQQQQPGYPPKQMQPPPFGAPQPHLTAPQVGLHLPPPPPGGFFNHQQV